MSRRIRWFDEAIAEFVSHVEYIAGESPAAAKRVADRITAAAEGLGAFAIGRPGVVPGTFERVLADIPYTIVYVIDEVDGVEMVSVLRVVHQAQQWPPETD